MESNGGSYPKLWIVIGVFLVVLGSSIGYIGYKQNQKAQTVLENAESVEAVMNSKKIEEEQVTERVNDRSVTRTVFELSLNYSYSVSGENYTSTQIRPDNTKFKYQSREKANGALENFSSVDSNFTAYYDPRNPSTAFIRKQTGGSFNIAIIAAIVAVFGGLLTFSGIRRV